jgi:hypothetical protein
MPPKQWGLPAKVTAAALAVVSAMWLVALLTPAALISGPNTTPAPAPLSTDKSTTFSARFSAKVS